ncbi:ABC transporter substrate-binding protein [Paenibacillus sp. N3.4]|uniref:ABC transporter substrate-binding protein n=1 Tax=Paenibacillus sp. N3.4 TaxID=2603222 RepID=UPI0011C85AFE|nr:ABC transporter substrate-binding protein [Paenibacillus sp. N3.4]TXK84471.1 carbohydrate ABC transporter substrate-binding protein [Paenibacillus sp. N3.4]
MRRKKWSCLALLAAVMLASGCSNNNNESVAVNRGGSETSATESASTSQTNQLKGKINIAIQYQPLIKPLQEEIKKYKQAQPGAEIELVPFGRENYYATMTTQLIGGSAPVGISVEPEGAQILANHLEPITSYMEVTNPYTKQKWRDDYNPLAYEITKAGTKDVWMIGIMGAVNTGLWVNEDLLNQLHATVPKSWSEFIDVQKKARDAGFIPFAEQYNENWRGDWSNWTLNYMFMKDELLKLDTIVVDGRVSQEEMARGVQKKLIDLKSDKVKDMFRTWKEWTDIAWPKNFSTKWGNSEAFLAGKALFYWGYSGETEPFYTKTKDKFKLGHIQVPNIMNPSDPSDLSNVATGWAMNKAATQQQKAILVDFMQYLSQPDVHKRIVESVGMLPVVKGVAGSDDLLMKEWASEARFNVSAIQPMVLDNEYSTKFLNESQSYLTGKETLDEFVSNYEKIFIDATNRLITEKKWDISKW